jgi:hypothetical protein
MKALVPTLLLAAALGATACASAPSEGSVQATRMGALMKRRLHSYHLVYSEHRGPIGYMKEFDVAEAGGPVFRWKFIYDRDFNELGWVDQRGHAFRAERYPPGAQPNPAEPFRFERMPMDSVERNTMRMLGIDPALDDVSFPLAKEGEIGSAK